LKKIVILRDEMAGLLGFENHAELRMMEKMAKSVLDVRRELMLPRSRLTPLAEMEIRRASELKIKNVTLAGDSFGEDTSRIYIWDWSFYDRMLKEQKYAFNNAMLAEYFEVVNTMKGCRVSSKCCLECDLKK
jgi:metallopeptidase MepB